MDAAGDQAASSAFKNAVVGDKADDHKEKRAMDFFWANKPIGAMHT
jgi:hypothetical protein